MKLGCTAVHSLLAGAAVNKPSTALCMICKGCAGLCREDQVLSTTVVRMFGREGIPSACWHTVHATVALQGRKAMNPMSRMSCRHSGRGKVPFFTSSRMSGARRGSGRLLAE